MAHLACLAGAWRHQPEQKHKTHNKTRFEFRIVSAPKTCLVQIDRGAVALCPRGRGRLRPSTAFRLLGSGSSSPNWAVPWDDINPGQGFWPRPLGAHGGPREPWDGSGLENSAGCVKNQLRRLILRPVRGYFALSGAILESVFLWRVSVDRNLPVDFSFVIFTW